MINKEFKATVVVLIIGVIVLFVGTDSFQAFTAEQARRVKVEEEQPLLIDVTLQDSQEKYFQLSDQKGVYTIATFIYTRCGDVCPVLSMNLKEVYDQLPEEMLGKKIKFLSISFDPVYDTPEQLSKYKEIMRIHDSTWQAVRIVDPEHFNQFLKQAGVVVIPNEDGGFTHNAAFYLINPEGRLIQIYDFDKPDQVADELKRRL